MEQNSTLDSLVMLILLILGTICNNLLIVKTLGISDFRNLYILVLTAIMHVESNHRFNPLGKLHDFVVDHPNPIKNLHPFKRMQLTNAKLLNFFLIIPHCLHHIIPQIKELITGH